MVDNGAGRYASIPIPSYEEATSSHTHSSHHLGAAESSDDHERQAFLGSSASTQSTSRHSQRRDGYRAPSVHSLRSSQDTLDGIVHSDDDDGGSDEDEHGRDGAMRRVMEEMDMGDDPDVGPSSRRGGGGRHRYAFSKRFGLSSLRSSWGGMMRLPSVSMPSAAWLSQRMPRWRWKMWSVPEQYRPGWQIIARLVGLFIVMGLLYALFVLEVMPGAQDSTFDPESVKSFAQAQVDAKRIKESLKYITTFSHVAGSEGDAYLAKWVQSAFGEGKMDTVSLQEFEVYLNYPKTNGRSVEVVEPKEKKWASDIEEPSPFYDPTMLRANTLVFHALSRAGNVTGKLVDAGYGTRADFDRLASAGTELKGRIALVRQDATPGSLGLKIKAAEERGVVGVLTFTESVNKKARRDDAQNYVDWNHWDPSESIQRDSVGLTNWVLGDVLTPGAPSTNDQARAKVAKNPGLVNIPSLPIAWSDAKHLLELLKSRPDAVVRLSNEQDEPQRQTIWNVIGEIKGTEQGDMKLVVGNPRDSWCFGAGDPGSGTAVMLEVIRILGELRRRGWRPRRSIVFASWDASQYNLIGSTEYVESNLKMLQRGGLAYLNVGAGVTGDKFRVAGSPALKQSLTRLMHRVGDPVNNGTIRDAWREHGAKFNGPGIDGDHAAFQDLAGMSSLDFGFEDPKGPSAHPYHSCFETFDWMVKKGDPGFKHHKALAEIWVLLILDLAIESLIPFDFRGYSNSMEYYVNELGRYAVKAKGFPGRPKFELAPLREAVRSFKQAADDFHNWEDAWFDAFRDNEGFELPGLMLQRRWHNNKAREFETNLLDLPVDGRERVGKQHGIPGREQFKHIVFGPPQWPEGIGYFPAVADAIDRGDWDLAQSQVLKAARMLIDASDKLVH